MPRATGVLVIALALLSGCQPDRADNEAPDKMNHETSQTFTSTTQDTSADTWRRDVEAQIAPLMFRYGAVVNWKPQDAIRLYGYYTIEVEDSLKVWNLSQPIIFPGIVTDIERRDGDYVLRFIESVSMFGSRRTRFFFDLTGDRSLVDRILKHGPDESDWDTGYVVVARITSARKYRVALVFKPEIEMDGEEPFLVDKSMAIDASQAFMLKGECLDVLYIEDEFELFVEQYFELFGLDSR